MKLSCPVWPACSKACVVSQNLGEVVQVLVQNLDFLGYSNAMITHASPEGKQEIGCTYPTLSLARAITSPALK